MDRSLSQFTNDEPIYYFGYGANRNKQSIERIVDAKLKDGQGAILQNYALCYQLLEQIPDPPKELLRRVWGDTFRCYTIHPFPKGIVAGVIWDFTKKQFTTIKEWEFDGKWKNIIEVPVTLFNGEQITAWTDIVAQTQPIYEAIDGLYYQNNLNPQGTMPGIEDEFRIEALLKARDDLRNLTFLKAKT